MNTSKRLLTLVPTLIILTSCTLSVPINKAPAKESQVQVNRGSDTTLLNYDDYATVLKTHVNNKALVNYQKLQQNPEQLETFNASLGAVEPSTYQSWDEAEKIAFLINAYNSFTLESIIDQNPLKKSIRDIKGVWKGREFNITGESKTLDNIEHKTLRAEFNEPRIHMALVCAAISCPPLRNEPYTGEKIDQQLDDQTQNFLVSPHGFRIDRQEGSVYLSSIFKWFGEDWKKTYGVDDKFTGNANQRAVLNFISNYLSPEDQEYLERGNYKIKYLNYDWSLNKQ
ncbi:MULTISPECIES: DUF547 domain-containing protein [Moorena]|uniref:DUF547 domain-containing protein n=1 Tax=Moorena producens 3L TaxID=489825 RepID=F4XIA5_9CYAN|nr:MULTISPECIES: DUF547 domain-containing protein [Moorena]EGJ35638.1 protein of unknown function, DUF547 [Moorena producens 3L]NEP37523.1 DUF547 domain-containing protein [Moorena sp. SIO3B2]NEP66687.1 DUF547 domain-containing protein [Moorena sp. SIO3A5]NER89533.1 DUF547 domain-containing protein [Moorena sp. SIO3A2]NES45329.1 DUF547 domain-containing protein [Moorena sp. SIO2C4]